MQTLSRPNPPAAPLECIECRRAWLDPAERWRLKVTDDTPAEIVPYCADCATREFGPARRATRSARSGAQAPTHFSE